jgi:hypothetical protein
MTSQTESLVAPSSSLVSDAVVSISYYTPPADGAPQLPIYIKDEKSRVTSKNNFQPVTVYDVRGSGVEHVLDKTGIQFVNYKSMMKDFDDDATIKESYYPEIADMLYRV